MKLGRIKAILFDLGDTLIVELDGPANVDTTEFKVLDGVVEVLQGLKGRYKLAIVSNTFNWGDREVTGALSRKDLTRFFDAIVTSVDAGSKKPDDGIYRKVLDLLECDPEQAIMVGDRVDTDIAGANMMGITSILCRWNNRYPIDTIDEKLLPDYVIGSIRELPALIKWLDKNENFSKNAEF
jgi:HAD superfamily hydrolase (TIGR01662 family)